MSKTNTIKVTVTGGTGVGKSAVVQILRRALAENSLQVNPNVDGYDPQLDEYSQNELRDVISTMNNNQVEVVISEVNKPGT